MASLNSFKRTISYRCRGYRWSGFRERMVIPAMSTRLLCSAPRCSWFIVACRIELGCLSSIIERSKLRIKRNKLKIRRMIHKPRQLRGRIIQWQVTIRVNFFKLSCPKVINS